MSRASSRGCALLLAALLAAPGAGASEWVRRDGTCTEVATFGDVARGPIALVNAAALPVRSLLGGLWFAAAECVPSLPCAPTAPLWIAGSTLWGTVRGVYWALTGALDTPTFGRLLLSPYEASRLRLYPVVPFLEGRKRLPEERCPPQPLPR